MDRKRLGLPLLLEWAINLVPWLGWIIMINAGTENGIGYFHQPDHELLWPLLNGAAFNAITFLGVGFFLVPGYMRRRQFARFFAGVVGLSMGVLVLKTAFEKLIIVLSMPDLAHLSFAALALENLYVLPFFVVLGMLYRFARDWFVDTSQPSAEPDWSDRNKVLMVKSGAKIHRVAVEDLLYLKSDGNYVVFVDARKKVMVNMTMAEALERLPEDDFVRIHRSYIVALRHIDTIEANRIKVRDRHLPIGGKYRAAFRRRLELRFRRPAADGD